MYSFNAYGHGTRPKIAFNLSGALYGQAYTVSLLPGLLFSWQYFDTVNLALNCNARKGFKILRVYITLLCLFQLATWLVYVYYMTMYWRYVYLLEFHKADLLYPKVIKNAWCTFVANLLSGLTQVGLIIKA